MILVRCQACENLVKHPAVALQVQVVGLLSLMNARDVVETNLFTDPRSVLGVMRCESLRDAGQDGVFLSTIYESLVRSSRRVDPRLGTVSRL